MRDNLTFEPKLTELPEYIERIVESLPSEYATAQTRMAVSEALLNAIIHGALRVQQREGAREPVKLAAKLLEAQTWCPSSRTIDVGIVTEHGATTLTVRDPGPGFDWRHVLENCDDMPAADATRGRGISVIRRCVDEVCWNESGNELAMRLKGTSSTTKTTRSDALDRTVPAPAPCPSPVPSSGETSRHEATPMLVLVVDDLEVNRRLLRGVLQGAGFEVVEAADGRAALSMLRSSAPDLVVLDLNMPRMSGLDVLGVMKHEGLTDRFPVVVLTATDPSPEVKNEAFERGVWQFLTKPIGGRELVTQLRSVAARSRAAARAASERDEMRVWADKATRLVTGLMPRPLTRRATADVHVAVHPCRGIGGDFADIIECGQLRWAVVLADVAGRGEPAALTAIALRSLARDRLTVTFDVDEALRALNHRLYEDFTATMQHASFAAVLVDELAGTVTMVNAGGPPLVAVLEGGETMLVHSSMPSLGLDRYAGLVPCSLPLSQLSYVAMLSDGLIERFARPGDTGGAIAALTGAPLGHERARFPGQRFAQLASDGEVDDDMSLVWLDFQPEETRP